MQLDDRPTKKEQTRQISKIKLNLFFLKTTNFKLIETKPLRITSAHSEG